MMHRILLTAVLAVVLSIPVQAISQADTVVSVVKPSRVAVIKSDGATVIHIDGAEDNDCFRYRYSVSVDTLESDLPLFNFPFSDKRGDSYARRQSEIDVLCGWYYGGLFPLSAPDPLRTSYEVGINRIIGYSMKRRGSEFSFGLGIGYRSVSVRRGVILSKDGDALVLASAPEGASDVSSYIESLAVQVPFVYTQHIYRSIGFSFGIVANVNFYTTAKMKYRIDDIRYSGSYKGLHQRLLTPDLLLTVGSVNNVGVYVRWSPVKPFKRAFGPAYTSLSVGLSLGF